MLNKKTIRISIKAFFVIAALIFTLCLSSCGANKNPSVEGLKSYREISWEGKELTVKLGTNKSTGCEWNNKFGDESIIDYSANRKFTLSQKAIAKDVAAGILSAGFEGKSEGTTTITFFTPCDWDGNEPGYIYIVTVQVAVDGTIISATGN